ncbi:hypothetical protein CEXT_659681 [Caerostris extrusa]|uniref:Uncharacterized protein n=1 Tax=Caerostris extrusa TaxID=172846 RepID=A0AAV4PHP4_CAEEX|nr:hypothetical protein CEXT_659681 [Caerostris extrusa]
MAQHLLWILLPLVTSLLTKLDGERWSQLLVIIILCLPPSQWIKILRTSKVTSAKITGMDSHKNWRTFVLIYLNSMILKNFSHCSPGTTEMHENTTSKEESGRTVGFHSGKTKTSKNLGVNLWKSAIKLKSKSLSASRKNGLSRAVALTREKGHLNTGI